MFRNVVTGTIHFSLLLHLIVELSSRPRCCTCGGSSPRILLSAGVHIVGEVEGEGGRAGHHTTHALTV